MRIRTPSEDAELIALSNLLRMQIRASSCRVCGFAAEMFWERWGAPREELSWCLKCWETCEEKAALAALQKTAGFMDSHGLHTFAKQSARFNKLLRGE